MFTKTKKKPLIVYSALLLCLAFFLFFNATGGTANAEEEYTAPQVEPADVFRENAAIANKIADDYFADEENGRFYVDYIVYPDLAILIDRADAVIIGEVLNSYGPVSISYSDSSKRVYYHDFLFSDILVKDVAMGNLSAGDVITFKQIMVRGTLHIFGDGDEYIIFMKDFSEYTDYAPFCFVNPWQGRIDYHNPDLKNAAEYFFTDGLNTGAEIWDYICNVVKDVDNDE